MPEIHYLKLQRPAPERIDLAAIKSDLEFIMERVAQLPTRRNLLHMAALIIVSTAGLELLGVWLLLR